MTAGQIRVACRDPVDEARLDQEIEDAVNRDRSDPALLPQPLDQIIGAERAFGACQLLQHPPAQGRQLDAVLPADVLGVPNDGRGVGTSVGVMVAVSGGHVGQDVGLLATQRPCLCERYNIT